MQQQFATVHSKPRTEVDEQIQQIAKLSGAANRGCDMLYKAIECDEERSASFE